MGTVHAKASPDDNRQSFFDDAYSSEPPAEETTMLKLAGVPARVDRVHVDGLGRTRDDIVKSMIDELFHATQFEDVIITAHKVRTKLESMGCFRDIGVFIDVSSGPGATPEGLEVTFNVKELSRVVGGVNTTVSENEGNLVVGVKMPNVLGGGERVAAEYSVGHRSTSNFTLSALKPFPNKPLMPVLSSSVFQQNHEFPTSGYKLLDRGVLVDVAFNTSPTTKHNLQWEGVVRDTNVLNKMTSFKVRENSGPQLKSSVRHTVRVDRRDDPVFPSRGTLLQLCSEVAGLGGGLAFLKSELQAQANVPLAESTALQGVVCMGVLHSLHSVPLPERFFVGGAGSVRGFGARGVGPHCDALALGGGAFWAAALHLYAPLPFRPAKGGLGDLFRSHLFLNAGSLQEDYNEGISLLVKTARVSAGLGVALRVGSAARLELNYCFPLRFFAGDRTAPGLQFGLAAHYL